MNWYAYVKKNLSLPELTREREEQIREDLALQFEQAFAEALTRGVSEEEAEATVRAHVPDWDSFISDVYRSERRNAKSHLDKWSDEPNVQTNTGGIMNSTSRWLSDFRQDLIYGLRTLRKSPGFTAVAVLTLALGIGATTAVFSVVHGILLKPLPYPEPDRLVRVFESNEGQPKFPLSPLNFLDYRADNEVFSGMAIYMRDDLELSGGDTPERLHAMRISSGFLELLGVQPLLGRTFRREEEKPENSNVVILSHSFWQERFSGDPTIIEKRLTLSGVDYTVIGVLPPGVQHVGGSYRSLPHGEVVDVWWPLALGPDDLVRYAHFTNGVARLRPNVEWQEAQAAMNILSDRMREQYENYGSWHIRLIPLKDEILGSTESLVLVFFGAVALVLLIACANVANLLINHFASRGREVALRSALGADRSRLVRQLLTEGLLLALLGGVLGSAFAFWGMGTLVAMAPDDLPRAHMIGIEPAFFAFALALTVATVMLFGLIPAAQVSRADLTGALKDGGRRGGGGATHRSTRNVLVMAEIGLAVVLLTGAGLLAQSYLNLQESNAGFDPQGVLTGTVTLPAPRYPGDPERVSFLQRLRSKISSLPGVTSAGLSSDLPWTGYDENSGFSIVGREEADPEIARGSARFHFVTPGYFETIGTPLLAGRNLTDSDIEGAPMVVLINESMARRYWPETAQGIYPVSARLNLWGEVTTVVGVVGAVKDFPADADSKPAFYFPFAQRPRRDRSMALALRTEGDPLAMAETVRRTVSSLDPSLPFADVRSLDQIATASFSEPRFSSLLVGLFAGAALLLATVGTYGVVSYVVGQRTHEFGVRIALGAGHRAILEMVLREGLRLALTGLALGAVGAFALTRLLGGMLYGVTATDPTTFLAVSAVLALTAMLACYIPARRATKVDPMVALRYE